jgi:hypothetical protein
LWKLDTANLGEKRVPGKVFDYRLKYLNPDFGGDTGCTNETDLADGVSSGSVGIWVIANFPANYTFADGKESTVRRACACR